MNTRRGFIEAGLAWLGFARSAWAQGAGDVPPVRYAALTKAVRIPVDAVAVPWQPVPFVAEARLPRRSAQREGGRRVLISGVLFRTTTQLSALCVTCPHEQCQVDLVTDEAQLTRMVGTAANPLFECGCHLSIFDAMNDGARIAGEAPRGLYRFRIGSVSRATVEITEVEADALSEV